MFRVPLTRSSEQYQVYTCTKLTGYFISIAKINRGGCSERGCSEYQVESKMIVGTELNKIMKLKTVPAKRAQKHFLLRGTLVGIIR